jgi:hypothetical protein
VLHRYRPRLKHHGETISVQNAGELSNLKAANAFVVPQATQPKTCSMPRGLVARPRTVQRHRPNAQLPIARMLSHNTRGSLRINHPGSLPNCSRKRFSPCSQAYPCRPFDRQSECPSVMRARFDKVTDRIREIGKRWLSSSELLNNLGVIFSSDCNAARVFELINDVRN